MNRHHSSGTTKRRKRLAFVVLAVISSVVAYGLLKRNDEPKYQGRYLSDWIKQYDPQFIPQDASLRRIDREKQEADAATALQNIGTNALPYLMKWMAYEPSAWRIKLADKQMSPGGDYLRVLGDAPFHAERAMSSFKVLGTNAASVVPELEALMKDTAKPWRARRAISALGFIGPSAIPSLKAALADPNQPQPQRINIIHAFGAMIFIHGKNTGLPILEEARDDPDPQVRRLATRLATNDMLRIAPEGPPNAPAK